MYVLNVLSFICFLFICPPFLYFALEHVHLKFMNTIGVAALLKARVSNECALSVSFTLSVIFLPD